MATLITLTRDVATRTHPQDQIAAARHETETARNEVVEANAKGAFFAGFSLGMILAALAGLIVFVLLLKGVI